MEIVRIALYRKIIVYIFIFCVIFQIFCPTVYAGQNGDGNQPDYSLRNVRVIGSSQIVGNHALVFPDYSQEHGVLLDSGKIMQAIGNPDSRIPKYTIVRKKIVADGGYYNNNFLSKISLPDGICEVGRLAFARSNLADISLPDTLHTISFGAFYGCKTLKNIQIPESVENICPKAFEHTGIWYDFHNNNDPFLIVDGVLLAYQGSEEKVIIPDGVRLIAGECFKDQKHITSVVMPDSLQIICEGAFLNCDRLETVQLNRKLKIVRDYAFLGCNKLGQITFESDELQLGQDVFGKETECNYHGVLTEAYEASSCFLNATVHENTGSNEDFNEENQDAEKSIQIDSSAEGITAATLNSAKADLKLKCIPKDADEQLEEAYYEIAGMSIPQGCAYYDIRLSDQTSVPVTELGNDILSLTLVLPDEFTNRTFAILSTDRNGQLVKVPYQREKSDSISMIRISLNRAACICLYPLTDNPAE